jgi:hypothetical protein
MKSQPQTLYILLYMYMVGLSVFDLLFVLIA